MREHKIPKKQLLKIQEFLAEVKDYNEDTEYDPSQEELVDSIKEMVRDQGKTSINEDFEVPYVHPMITIQKWSIELKQMVDDILVKDF